MLSCFNVLNQLGEHLANPLENFKEQLIKENLKPTDDNSLFSVGIGIPVVLFLFENLKHV